MSTRCTTPQACAAGSTSWATLWVPNVTVRSARTCGPSSAPGVDVHAGRHVDRDDRRARRSDRAPPRPRSRRPGRPPMPTIPSTTTSGACGVGRRRPCGRPAAAAPPSPSACTFERQQHGLDRAPAASQQRAGPQRVAAVVAGADEQQHPGGVRRRRAGRRWPRRARRPPAASARLRAAGPSAPPRPPGPARPCVRCACSSLAGSNSSTTNAERDATVVGEREVHAVRRRAPAPRRRPCRCSVERGRPAPRPTTSASCQDSPAGAPSALASASLAANRAASDATGSAASAGVNSRSRSVGRALQRLLEAGDVDHVDAHARRSRRLTRR